MSIQALNIALSGLRVAKRSLDVTSNNIANAGVDGYTRKILPQITSLNRTDGTFFGVAAGSIGREMDFSLRRDLWNQISTSSYLEARSSYLNRVQTFHGSSEREDSISTAVSALKDSFAQLATSPDDVFLQNNVLNSAQATATKINNFSDFLTNSRNDAQSEMVSLIGTANNLMESIHSLNLSIQRGTSTGQSTAELEDQRDKAVKELSGIMGISTYTRGDGAMVVQTKGGTPLVDYNVERLTLLAQPLGPSTVANPVIMSSSGINISTISVGGRLEALLELRDETLPSYQAQLDEFAHKLALRFDAQGMRLFTNSTGNVPGLATANYLGFSSTIQVNPAFVANPGLLRDGTEASITVGQASSNVIQKILDYTFGDSETTQALGNVDISGGGPLFGLLGLSSAARVAGTQDITALGVLDSSPNINPGDAFTIQLGAGLPVNIPIGAGDTAADLVNTINGLMGPNLTASLGSNGQLVLSGDDDITIGAGTLAPAGLAELGLSLGTTNAQDPTFTVQLSTGQPQTITITSATTAASLLADLNAIPGLTATLNGSGFLQVTPEFGGDLRLTDTNGSTISSLGIAYSDVAHDPIQSTGLGASGTISTNISTPNFIEEFGRRIVTAHADDYNAAQQSYALEGDYKNVLEKSMTDKFGVDIDQEVAFLIQVQTNYSANARVVEAARQIFDELLNIF